MQENRLIYDQSIAETLHAEKAWTELHDLLSQLQTKMAEAANTIRYVDGNRIRVETVSWTFSAQTDAVPVHSATPVSSLIVLIMRRGSVPLVRYVTPPKM